MASWVSGATGVGPGVIRYIFISLSLPYDLANFEGIYKKPVELIILLRINATVKLLNSGFVKNLTDLGLSRIAVVCLGKFITGRFFNSKFSQDDSQKLPVGL
jgi:hypothetical protein